MSANFTHTLDVLITKAANSMVKMLFAWVDKALILFAHQLFDFRFQLFNAGF